jgi:hypothetical protein
MITVKQPHGGAIKLAEKGDRLSPGRPKSPRKLKEFIKELENEDDQINFSFDLVELIPNDKKDKERVNELFEEVKSLCKGIYYKNSKGAKMFLTAYKRALKGDVKWAEFLVKMGFAGGFEPTRVHNGTVDKNGELITPQETKITIIKNYNGNQSDTETNASVGLAN